MKSFMRAGDNGKPRRLAVVGCGAVAERYHLPALERLGIRPALLIDADAARAELLAGKYGSPAVSTDYRAALEGADAAIVALPNSFHAPVSIELLQHGVHVLVEKPMAISEAECNDMIAASDAGNAVLAIGLWRRFLKTLGWLKEALNEGLIGELRSLDAREGWTFSWPVVSASFFRREIAGGGVLIDAGAHTIDLILWWLGREALIDLEYRDDNRGGVEADCELRFRTASGVEGFVELSRTRILRNTAILRGERGEIEVSLHGKGVVGATPSSLLKKRVGRYRARSLPTESELEAFPRQIEDWLRAIDSRQPPAVSGEEAARSIKLIESCYQQRRPLLLPWELPTGAAR